MKYIYITLDAIDAFSNIRQYQTVDYPNGKKLYEVLIGNSYDLEDKQIFAQKLENGLVFHTSNFDRSRAIIFDLSTFDAFIKQDAKNVITIFHKILKYAIKYFNHLTYAPCEKDIDTKTTIIYPFPFTATKNVYKILIDKNSSKYSKKDKNILTVFYSGDNSNNTKVSFTALNKAMEEIKHMKIIHLTENFNEVYNIDAFRTTNLNEFELSLDASIGYENWEQYLTDKQKEFIYKDVSGAERLEGAAGTGKTLSMVLRCIYLLKKNPQKRYVFVTHSKATKEHIIQIFKNNYTQIDDLLCYNDEDRNNQLLVITLQEWCIHFLGVYLTETEYLDKDAQESKLLQLMYIEQAYDKVIEKEWNTYKNICSPEFVNYVEQKPREYFLEILQYEIATLIKGMCSSDIDKYMSLDRPQYAIPCINKYDKTLLFLIFQQYQKDLEMINQFDSDDIILTALGQLNTPIWKRRRNQEGFDACFIDETHLFNINELSIFHYLNKENAKNNIIFAIDKSQHIGERRILDDTIYDILNVPQENRCKNKYDIVFRSSPEIVNLAYNILSSGVCVFDHFENPLIDSTPILSKTEMTKCENPRYELLDTDEAMIVKAFEEIDVYSKRNNIPKSNVLIIPTSLELFKQAEKYAEKNHKQYTLIKSRGDAGYLKSTSFQNQYIIGAIDYIGGLEFDYVILIGVDDARVPPKYTNEAFHFTNYAWHNRMYVAITRARYALLMLGNKSLGQSSIMESAINLNVIEFKD